MDYKLMLAIMVPSAVISVVAIIMEAKKKSSSQPVPPPPPLVPSRTSVLAALSFLSGLVAFVLVVAAGIVAACAGMSEVTEVPADVLPHVDLASRIVLYASVLPAAVAVAFALAARGAVAESRGALRGRSLYRTGILLALVTGALVVNGNAVTSGSWADLLVVSGGGSGGAGGPGGVLPSDRENLDRGYLGIEHEATPGGVRIVRVVPGTPAERAGLQATDVIIALDGASVGQHMDLADRIARLGSGSKVDLTVRRGGNSIVLTAVLTAPFSTLHALLEDASTDRERLTILKTAAADRAFTATELKSVCETFSSDMNREEAVTLALPQLLDPQNAYLVLPTFTSSIYKDNVSLKIVDRVKSKK
jgi:hypothetical protein